LSSTTCYQYFSPIIVPFESYVTKCKNVFKFFIHLSESSVGNFLADQIFFVRQGDQRELLRLKLCQRQKFPDSENFSPILSRRIGTTFFLIHYGSFLTITIFQIFFEWIIFLLKLNFVTYYRLQVSVEGSRRSNDTSEWIIVPSPLCMSLSLSLFLSSISLFLSLPPPLSLSLSLPLSFSLKYIRQFVSNGFSQFSSIWIYVKILFEGIQGDPYFLSCSKSAPMMLLNNFFILPLTLSPCVYHTHNLLFKKVKENNKLFWHFCNTATKILPNN